MKIGHFLTKSEINIAKIQAETATVDGGNAAPRVKQNRSRKQLLRSEESVDRCAQRSTPKTKEFSSISIKQDPFGQLQRRRPPSSPHNSLHLLRLHSPFTLYAVCNVMCTIASIYLALYEELSPPFFITRPFCSCDQPVVSGGVISQFSSGKKSFFPCVPFRFN